MERKTLDDTRTGLLSGLAQTLGTRRHSDNGTRATGALDSGEARIAAFVVEILGRRQVPIAAAGGRNATIGRYGGGRISESRNLRSVRPRTDWSI